MKKEKLKEKLETQNNLEKDSEELKGHSKVETISLFNEIKNAEYIVKSLLDGKSNTSRLLVNKINEEITLNNPNHCPLLLEGTINHNTGEQSIVDGNLTLDDLYSIDRQYDKIVFLIPRKE